MTLTLMGKKEGMTRLADEAGNLVVCTVISAEPHLISQIKSENDGYNAVVLSSVKLTPSKAKKLSKPMQGHFAKAGIDPRRYSKESRVDSVEGYAVGQEIGVDYFKEIAFVDVAGKSKGKGFQGVMKRHGFAGMPASHGCSVTHRHAGSTGMRSTPGRCLPGVKKPGRMGAEKVTIMSLPVVRVDEKRQVIIVKGAIPGPRGSMVSVRKAIKKSAKK